ncbi:septum site-determining protein MinC [Candidatus Regiella insecticola 5.15]|uniref:Probable septum site-determining protein MinC n=1 Tax=Candidatus Regiella insecticola 5.15 TaxID=1005043 RepID=G2GWY1_9ENTR|nr:septum site-determining protein MinC [Candidatus Regiella insecticola]EGY29765.1 septum site-determining protein MinC [Candidatus Regiella insecticola 5.15]
MSSLPSQSIEFKGSNFTLSVLHLYDPRPEIIRQALEKKMLAAKNFFKNAPIVINVALLPQDTNWLALRQAVSSVGLHIVGVNGHDSAQRMALIQAGLPLLSEGQHKKDEKKSEAVNFPAKSTTKTRVINAPVRSGQQVRAPCDLVVIGNVSAGAEVIADGNIHIYGKLRGRALAGASGNIQTNIFCMVLDAELVSIAGTYWLKEHVDEKYMGKAVHLHLLGDALKIELLNPNL